MVKVAAIHPCLFRLKLEAMAFVQEDDEVKRLPQSAHSFSRAPSDRFGWSSEISHESCSAEP
jgi:hypothetical protein